jgi:glycosyltransferase involved in cell wall biosynthesis
LKTSKNLDTVHISLPNRKKVVIIQRTLPHYRIGFFNLLKSILEIHQIQLVLIYGNPNAKESKKKDDVHLDWAIRIDNMVINLHFTQVIWQPCIQYLGNTDLVIVEQANKNLINHILMLSRLWSRRKLAFWGHGRNRQIGQSNIRNKIKDFYLDKCDWWFAYTDGVKNELIRKGYPEAKITAVQNSIDTKQLRLLYEAIDLEESRSYLSQQAITASNLAVYCGGLYKEKRLDFLLDVCKEIRKAVTDFEIIIIGGGPEEDKVIAASNKHSWFHYVGPKFEKEKVVYFKASKFMMMPGLVGLGVLDSFTCETPIITTDYAFHSPEIDYLKHGENGLISYDTREDYIASVLMFLKDSNLQKNLVSGCVTSYKKYTIDAMASKFAAGIVQCITDGQNHN